MSVNLSLNQITFQSSIRSKPVKENFTDTENGVNDLQAQIDALATPPAGTEVTNARDYHSILRDRLRSGFSVFDRYMVSGGLVSQDTGLNMKVTVALGEAVVAGVGCIWAAQNSGTITPHATLDRWDTVVVNSDNSISIVAGTAAASPVLPTIASTQKKLAHILITAAMAAIVDADIIDARTETKNQTFFGFEPIGTIKAWHKSFTNTPSLKKGDAWKECDGTTIDDPESPYAGQTIPDLNGGARFLRGSGTSGTMQAEMVGTHTHVYRSRYTSGGGGETGVVDQAFDRGGVVSTAEHQSTSDNNSGTETRPINMSVVWIMRIK